MNDLQTISNTLDSLENEIQVDETVRQQALVSVQRMMDFVAAHI